MARLRHFGCNFSGIFRLSADVQLTRNDVRLVPKFSNAKFGSSARMHALITRLLSPAPLLHTAGWGRTLFSLMASFHWPEIG